MRFLALAGVLWPALALGNGRPPLTNGVHFQPGDPHAIYLATTFGLLVSRDDGCSFRWICEDNIGYGGTFDPKYRIATDGTLFATTFSGLRISRDGGCSFTTATEAQAAGEPGRIAGKWIDAIDIGPTGEVWVATADSGKPNDLYRSTDNGVTFTPRGMQSPTIWWKSILVAPTRATRVYATGYQVAGPRAGGGQLEPTAHLEITDDDGEHWAASPMTGVQFGSPPMVFVVGVDHSNPDIVLLTSTGANPPSGDRLYRSIDGGATFTEVLATAAPILDVALADSGSVLVATIGGAAFRSGDRGAAFTAMPAPPQLACVGQAGDGTIFGCGANWEPDFKALAKSTDGATWTRAFRFVELAGPVECAAGTPQRDVCGGQWPAVQQQFGTVGPTSCVAPAPAPDTTPAKSGGCCDAGARSPGELGALGLVAVICGARLRRRRARGL